MAYAGNDSNVSIVDITHNYSIYYDYDDWNPFEYHSIHHNRIFYLGTIGFPIAIFAGVFANIFALVVLVRGRLWLKHEGYVYLAANFCANVGILMFCTSSFWFTSVVGMERYSPANTSTFVCKMWHFLMSIFFALGWFCVALLFNVYLREHLIHRRRCGCPMFAAKYCTLFASKIIVGVIFSALLVLGVPYLAIYELRPLVFSKSDRMWCFPSSHEHLAVALLVEAIAMWAPPFLLFLPIILLMMMCTKREGNTFGFSQIEERSVSDDQMRVMAVTLSSTTLFSQFVLVFLYLAWRNIWYVDIVLELVFCLFLSLQPIMCSIILKALRDGFRSQLRNIRCCRRLFPSLDREEEAVRFTAIQEDPPSRTESTEHNN